MKWENSQRIIETSEIEKQIENSTDIEELNEIRKILDGMDKPVPDYILDAMENESKDFDIRTIREQERSEGINSTVYSEPQSKNEEIDEINRILDGMDDPVPSYILDEMEKDSSIDKMKNDPEYNAIMEKYGDLFDYYEPEEKEGKTR